jgi:phage replication O-like protein O
MSSPQVENGYTRIANELLEAILRYRCSGAQKDIILAVIRATYGFHQKSRAIGTAYLAKLTGRHPRNIAAGVAELLRRKVLTETQVYTANKPRTLSLNKNYDEWVPTKRSRGMSEITHRVCMKSLIGYERNHSPNKNTLKEIPKGSEAIASPPNQPNKSFQSVSPVRAFETWWAAEWQRRFGVNYDFKYAKEGSLVKRMLKTCDGHLERLKQIAAAHFDSSDNLTERSGYEIGILSMRFNQLNARLNGTRSGETKPAGPTETQKILMEMEI